MSRIIKLTESQLCDMVTRVINEQNATPLVDEIYKEFVAGGTGAKPTSHTVMASAINKIPDYKTLIAFNNKFKQNTPAGFNSFVQALQGWLKVGEENIFKNIQAKLKTLGVSLIISNPSGIFEPADIRIEKGGVKKPDPKKIDPNKPTYKICQGFPIKYGCKQTEVGTLQKCMGMGVDYSFGPETLGAFLKLNPDPKAKAAAQKQILEVGLSEGAYKLVIAKCKSKIKKIKKPTAPVPVPEPTPVPVPEPTPVPVPVDTRTPMSDIQRLSSKDLKMVSSNLGDKLPQVQLDPITLGSQIYGRLSSNKNFNSGKIGDNRVKYKGSDLNPADLDRLNKFITSRGYKFIKNKDKGEQYTGGEDDKYVWLKTKSK
jgi:hypothetical protein